MSLFLILALLAGGYIAFKFVVHKANVERAVRDRGGVDVVYSEFISFFLEKGFRLTELTANSAYLHYGTAAGKLGVQIVVTGHNRAEIIIGEEMALGPNHQAKSTISDISNQRDVAHGLISQMPCSKELLSLPPV